MTDAVVEWVMAVVGGAVGDRVPDTVRQKATAHLVDAVGCALAARDRPTVRAALASSPLVSGPGTGRVLGYAESSAAADASAFANTAMIRYLDYNDWLANGHPSDAIGGLLALADRSEVSGASLVDAVAVAYEVFGSLTEASRLATHGWDQASWLGVATAAGLASMLRLPTDAIRHALAITTTSGFATRATRRGALSMWKGCATAMATRNAVFAILLAEQGMTAPTEPFAGPGGVWETVTGPFEITASPGAWTSIGGAALKRWPVCFHVQSLADAGVELSRKLRAADVRQLAIEVYPKCWESCVDHPSRWAPTTRETAVHSAPYALACALVDGEVRPDRFDASDYLTDEVRALVDVMTFSPTQQASPQGRPHFPVKVTATTRADVTETVSVSAPSGHPDNPMTWEQLTDKFTAGTRRVFVDESAADEVFEAWAAVSQAESMTTVLDRTSALLTKLEL